jgi:hypothetical protein
MRTNYIAIAYLTLAIASLCYCATAPMPQLCDMCDSRARVVVDVLREGLVIFIDGYPHRTYETVRKSPRCWGHNGEFWNKPLEPHESVRKENEERCWEMGWEYTVE